MKSDLPPRRYGYPLDQFLAPACPRFQSPTFREFPVPQVPLARRPRLVDRLAGLLPHACPSRREDRLAPFQIRDFLLQTFVFSFETFQQIQNIVKLAENLVAAVFLLFRQLILLSC